MAYKDTNAPGSSNGAPQRGRGGKAYRDAVEVVRQRARAGVPCYFCGQPFDFSLHHNHPRAFTAHHLDRIMDGGVAVPDPARMAPACRSCNSADGLKAQNDRRKGLKLPPQAPQMSPEHDVTSQEW